MGLKTTSRRETGENKEFDCMGKERNVLVDEQEVTVKRYFLMGVLKVGL